MQQASTRSALYPELDRLLSTIRRKLGAEHVSLRALRALTVVLGILAGVYFAAWLTRLNVPGEVGLGLIVIVLCAAIAGAASQWPTAGKAAREADRRLDLEERLTTAYDSAIIQRAGPVAQLQVASAVELGRERLSAWQANRHALRQESLRALVFGMVALAMFLISGFGDSLAVPRPDVAALLNPNADPPQPEQAIPDPPPLPKPDSPSAASPIARALDDVRRARESNGISQEDAERRVAQAETELRRQAQESHAQRQELGRLARGLSQTSAGRPAAESIERGDYQEAAERLEELGNEADQLSQAAREELAQALRAASQETSQNRLLAERERRAADALAGRDYTQQRRSLRELGEEVKRAGSFVTPQQDLAEGMSAVRDAQRDLGRDPAQQQQQDERPTANPSGQGARVKPNDAATRQGQQQDAAAAPRPPGATSPGQSDGQDESGGGGGSNPGTEDGSQHAPDAAPRLDVVGRPVEVPVKVGRGPITDRPGADDPNDAENAPATVTSAGLNQPQDPSAATAERNTVPSDRRQTVRDYFRGETTR